MKQVPKPGMIIALCLVAAPLVTRADTGDIFKLIPDDARIAIVAKNINELDSEISNYAAKLGRPFPNNIIGTILQNMTISNGISRNGEIGIAAVKLPPEKAGLPTGSAYVLILPTTDSKSMLANLHPTPPINGISMVTLPNLSENGYVSDMGNFVVIAQQKEVLAAVLAHKVSMGATNPRILRTFENNNFVIYINVPEYREMLNGQVERLGKQLLEMKVAGGLSELMAERVGPMLRTGISQYLDDTLSVVATVGVDSVGLTVHAESFFKPGSPTAKLATALKTAKPANLIGLPAGDFLAAGAVTWDPSVGNNLAGYIITQILSNPTIPANGSSYKKLAELEKRIAALTEGGKFEVLTGADMQPHQWTSIVVDTDDPEALEAVIIDTFKQLNGNVYPYFTISVAMEPTAVLIKHVRLTKYIMKLTPLAETPDHPRSEQIKNAIKDMTDAQGPDGFVFYSCATNKKLLAIMGDDSKILDAAVTALQTNAMELQAKGDSILRPAQAPIAEFYLSAEHLNALAQSLIQPTATTMPNDPTAAGLLPATIKVTTSDDSIGCEVHIPKDLLILLGRDLMPVPGLH